MSTDRLRPGTERDLLLEGLVSPVRSQVDWPSRGHVLSSEGTCWWFWGGGRAWKEGFGGGNGGEFFVIVLQKVIRRDAFSFSRELSFLPALKKKTFFERTGITKLPDVRDPVCDALVCNNGLVELVEESQLGVLCEPVGEEFFFIFLAMVCELSFI